MSKSNMDIALTYGFFEPLWGGDQVPTSNFQSNIKVHKHGDQIDMEDKNKGKKVNDLPPPQSSNVDIEYVDEVFPNEEDEDSWIEEISSDESDTDWNEETEKEKEELTVYANKYRDNGTNRGKKNESIYAESEIIETDIQLQEIINRFGPLSSKSTILGICEDGLPILIDFTDPKPGSLLIVSDRTEWNTHHLQSILASVCMLNSSDIVHITGIGPKLKIFREIPFSAHQGLKVGRIPDLESYALLEETFSIVENRRTGSLDKSNIQVFVIDQLDLLLDSLDAQSLSFLRWLVKRGPSSHVWVIATVSAKSSLHVDWKTFKSFGTILAGYMSDEKFSKSITGFSYTHIEKLLPGKQTCVKLGDEVIRYRIPLTHA